MSQEIEIEFKNLITKTEFHQLIEAFDLSTNKGITQINYYFDTPDMLLKTHQCALRIRKKDNKYILTLKQPHKKGLLETHQNLSIEEVNDTITKGLLPEGEVRSEIIKLIGNGDYLLQYLGELKTDRIEKKIPEGLIVLDNSFYLDTKDYELEFECSDPVAGEKFFLKLLTMHNIPIRNTPNKIQRFYNKKMEQKENE